MPITLYSANTPNGQKIPLILEELGLEYTIKYINILKNEQFDPEFLKLNPNNKIPTITDNETGQTVFESGAILMYLADKSGQLLPSDNKWQVIEWLFFQNAGIGPMFGQLGHFRIYAKEKVEYGINRYQKEAERLADVLNTQLTKHQFIAGSEYSIADISTWPWINSANSNSLINLDNYPALQNWWNVVGQRPAVIKGLAKLKDATT